MILAELTGKAQDTETRRLDPRTHNKAIQKACESYRIPEERKALLRTLKISVKKEKTGNGYT